MLERRVMRAGWRRDLSCMRMGSEAPPDGVIRYEATPDTSPISLFLNR